MSSNDLFALMDRVVNATALSPEDKKMLMARGDMHAGLKRT